jgi:hypothetical protein
MLVGLVGLILVAQAATARGQEAAPTAAAAPSAGVAAAPVPPSSPSVPDLPPRPKRMELALSILPMSMGRFTTSPGGVTSSMDAPFAYGFGVSFGYAVLPGLTVGLAPQAIFNVNAKTDASGNPNTLPASKQFDVMARIAYAYPMVDSISVYAEFLPGYSLILPPDGDKPKGFVLGFGAGATMNMTDRVFASLGAGYQLGYQKLQQLGMQADTSTRYLRMALSGGVRF